MGGSNSNAGRKAKPIALKVLEGSRVPKGAKELEVKVEAPVCPDDLSDRAKAEWARVVPHLVGLGLIGLIDRAALVGYCKAYAMMFDDDPRVSLKAIATLRSFCAEFGMTPSSRGRMQFPKGKGHGADEGERDLD